MFTNKKKLNLRQVHSLYLTLKPALPETEERFLLNEVSKMLGRMTEEMTAKAFEILKIKEGNGVSNLTAFVRSLQENNFFEYVAFIKKMK